MDSRGVGVWHEGYVVHECAFEFFPVEYRALHVAPVPEMGYKIRCALLERDELFRRLGIGEQPVGSAIGLCLTCHTAKKAERDYCVTKFHIR